MMRICRYPIVVLALWASAPAPAGAQPGETEERPALRLGPVELRPRVLLNNVGVDNNVFNEAENPKRDWTFTAQPDLEMTVRPGRARIVWLTGSEFVYYRRYESQRKVNRSQTISADVDLNVLRPFATYTSASTSARPNIEIDERARRHPTAYTFGTAVKLATRTTATFTLRGSREEYDGGVEFRGQELARTLNNRGRVYEGSLGLQVTPLTTISLVAARDEIRFDQEPSRDSNSFRIAPTLNISPLGLLNGAASIGYRRLNGLDPSLPDYSGVTMNGTLSLLLDTRYRFESRFIRDVQYSYEQSLPYYVQTGARLSAAAQVSDWTDLRLSFGRDQMKYRAFGGRDVPGDDSLRIIGAGMGFLLGDRQRLVIQAEFTRRHSTRDRTREFRNTRVFATLTLGA